MYLKSFPARIGIRPNIKITVKRTCGVLNRLFTFARLFGSQPSSHAINNDFVAQEKVELMLVANAKRPAPTIKATYIDGGNIALATSANGFPAVVQSVRFQPPRSKLMQKIPLQLPYSILWHVGDLFVDSASLRLILKYIERLL